MNDSAVTLRRDDVQLRVGVESDEELYIEGVKDMFFVQQMDWNTELADRSFFRRLVRNGTVLVAFNRTKSSEQGMGFLVFEIGKCLPFVPLAAALWHAQFVFIADVYVRPECRNLGIASMLYKQVDEVAREKGIQEVQCAVYCSNSASLNYHLKIGFTPFASVLDLNLDGGATKNNEDVAAVPGGDLVFRPFDSEKDASNVAGRLAGMKDNLETIESLQKRFNVMLCCDSDKVVAFFSYCVTNETPYGVFYGEYRYPYVFLHCVFAETQGARFYRRRIIEYVRQVARENEIHHVKTGLVEGEELDAWVAEGFQRNVVLLRRQVKELA